METPEMTMTVLDRAPPETFDEFMEDIFAPDRKGYWEEHRLLEVASALGATGDCFCSTTFILPDIFAEAIEEHYGLDGDQIAQLNSALYDCGADVGGGPACSYHAEVLSRDD